MGEEEDMDIYREVKITKFAIINRRKRKKADRVKKEGCIPMTAFLKAFFPCQFSWGLLGKSSY